MNSERKKLIYNVIQIFLIIIAGFVGTVAGAGFIAKCNIPIILQYNRLFLIIFIVIMTGITAVCIVFFFIKRQFIYKTAILCLAILSVIALGALILQEVGFFDKIKSVEDLRDYINGFGGFAEIIFVLLQFLQVAVLPIPGFLTVGAGVLLFGPLKGALLSSLGIILGSFAAFFIGRVFGYKVACWLVGKDDLDKGLNSVKGKDKIILTFMFLFPFFPDDVLCFVAGLSSMSWKFFIIMTIITRLISVFSTTYSINGSIIPYNTWWGILLWVAIFIICILFALLIYKKGEKIENYFKKLFSKNKNKKTKNN